MKKLLCNILLFLFIQNIYATNYYVSADGNDTDDGTSSSTAWKTLDKINASMHLFSPGDSVLFERGGIYHGTLEVDCNGTEMNPITFAGYGRGSEPLIDGSENLTGWSSFSEGIWFTQTGSSKSIIKNLFIDGKVVDISRHPNTAYYISSGPEGKNILFNEDFRSFSDNFWSGADIVIRTANWILDAIPLESHSGNEIVLAQDATYDLKPDYGFFIQNHINALDQEGEWCFTEEGKIFLYTKEMDPDNHTVTISNYENGILLESVNYIVISDLEISYQQKYGIFIKDSDNISIENNLIRNSGVNAVQAENVTNLKINDNGIDEANNNGIDLVNVNNGKIQRNSLKKTGIHPGRGLNGNLQYFGIIVNRGNELLIKHNTIDSTGYNGIAFFRAANVKVHNNFVNYSCLVKDDGGGIYTWENNRPGNEIVGNLIFHTIGEPLAIPENKRDRAHGIYVDDRSEELLVKNNTVAYSAGNGIYIHNAGQIDLIENCLIYNPKQLSFSAATDCPGNVVEKNILWGVDNDQFCLNVSGTYNEEANFPEFNNNYYCKFITGKVTRRSFENSEGRRITEYLTYSQWEEISGETEMKGLPVAYNDAVISRDEFLLFLYNPDESEKTYALEGYYLEMNDSLHSGEVTISPFSSMVLVKDIAYSNHPAESLISSRSFQFFPNPAGNIVNVRSYPGMEIDCIYIMDITGSFLLKKIIKHQNSCEIDLKDLASGIYIISALMDSRFYAKRIVIE